MDADGSNVVDLTNSPGVGDDRPAWSPDGRQIAWRRFVGGNFDIWVMNADGSGAKQLTFDATAESFPAFAPDNSRILFARDTDGDSSADEIYAMNLDGSGQVNLTSSGAGDNDNAPDWQPIPLKCGGKRSTQVGTAGKNKLVGTAQRDVISVLGGKDTIRGLGGNDILCGGGGPDRIAGGKGRGDRCIGGKALDRAAACERSKGI